MRRPILALVSVAALSIGLVGCGAQQSSGNGPAPSSKPQYGGTAVYALQEQTSPNWFFPLVSLSADTVINFQTDFMMYKPLLYFNQNDQLDLAHSLAKSVTWNKTDNVYTIVLNPKWHWSNNTPVTAQDVVFTWDIMKAASEPNTNYAWSFSGEGFGGIPNIWQSVVASGPDTVVVTTTKPRNPEWFIRNGLDEIIPIPKSVWDKYPNNMSQEMSFINSVANSPLNPVYSVVDGPYKLSSYQANNYWDFVPNPNYDGHKSYLSKVVFQYETSSSSEFAALKTGTVNVGYLGVSLLSARSQLTHDQMSVAYPLGFDYMNINLNPAAPGGIGTAFNTLPVRQALQLGVDEEGMIQHIFHGFGVIDDSTLAPEPKTAFWNPALAKQPYAYNPALGKKILENAGWHDVNGVMTKHGVKLEFTLYYASGSQSGTDMVELLKQDWAQEGIVANLVSEPFDTVVSYGQSNANKWAIIDWDQGNLGGWTYGNPYPSGGGLFGTGGGENSGGYNNQEMDTLIQATYEPGTDSQILQRLYAYEAYAARQLPGAIFLPWEPLFNVHADNIHGVTSTFNPIGDVIHPNYWWISK